MTSTSARQPNPTTPVCTAVSASAGAGRFHIMRLVRQTMTARNTAAASISASPKPSLAPGPPPSSAAPSSDTDAQTSAVPPGLRCSSHHSANGVNTMHRLIRNAALAALVWATPKVSHNMIASSSPPSGSPAPIALRRSTGLATHSAGSSNRKVHTKRTARKRSTG